LHELGVVIEVVKTVENFAEKNGLTKIDELSSMIRRYIESCYPAAVDGTRLQDTKLKIEILPGNALCKKCKKVFNIIENNSKCPNCTSERWELLCGKEFMIKEIVAC